MYDHCINSFKRGTNNEEAVNEQCSLFDAHLQKSYAICL